MSRVPPLREIVPLPDEVIQAGLNGDLILFVGAGVSRLLDLPSWLGLAACVLEDLRKEGYLNYSEIDQLQMQEAKKQLSIAKLIADDNEFKLDIGQHLEGKTEGGRYLFRPAKDQRGRLKYYVEPGCHRGGGRYH